MIKETTKIMSVTDVAHDYGITRQAVLEMLKRGELDAYKISKVWCIEMTPHTLSRLALTKANKEAYVDRMNKHRQSVLESLKKEGMPARVCPICGRVYTDEPALSRKDNKTAICSQCGLQEALDAFTNRHREVS